MAVIDGPLSAVLVSFFALVGTYVTVKARGKTQSQLKKPMTTDQQSSAMYEQINKFIDDQNNDREYLKNEIRQLRVDYRLQQLEIQQLRKEGLEKDERIDILQGQLDNEKKNNKILRKTLEQLKVKLKAYQEKK